MFISPDPVWNSQDPSYWSYAGSDPINHFDRMGNVLKGLSPDGTVRLFLPMPVQHSWLVITAAE